MGRRQGRSGAVVALAALTCGAATPADLPIREARWLQSRDLATDLTHQPDECRSPSADANIHRSEEIGRIMFRSPLLLGGQAARAGLSCSSCHRNGRSNVYFHFPGISGAPGTADVTASLMSSHRGDGIFNPKTIPDLAAEPARLKISRDPSRNDLKTFIHGLITQEFDGAEPSPAVLQGLADYVRSLSPAGCKQAGHAAVRLGPMLDFVDEAVQLASRSFAGGDRATGRSLIAAARSMLGTIDERFQLRGGEASRLQLRNADSELKSIELADDVSSSAFDGWRRSWRGRARALRSAETRSYFSEQVLRRALGER